MKMARGALILLVCALATWAVSGCADGRLAADKPPGAPAPTRVAASALSETTWFEGEPGTGVVFQDFPAQNDKTSSAWGPIMTDVIQHLPLSYGNTYYDNDKITYTHETSHGIHSHIRNNLNDTGERANGFYIPGNRAALVVEPNIRKSDIAQYVPQALRGSRFELYLIGSSDWDDTPLYIWDEWNAYINGGEAGVELVQSNLWDAGWRDGVAGQLEFTVYGIATAMAVRDLDEQYFNSNTQFREFLAFSVKRAMDSYRVGSTLETFAWETQDNYYNTLENSPEAADIRDFAVEIFGQRWTDTNLFGRDVQPPVDDTPIDEEGDDDQIGDPNGDDLPDGIDPPPAPPEQEDDNFTPGEPGDDNVDPPQEDDDFEPNEPPRGEPPADDLDRDAVPNDKDLCSKTPYGQRVWLSGEWLGCAEGQFRDRLPPAQGPDFDRDGIEDNYDLCGDTPYPSLVWGSGEWAGCAEGEYRDRARPGGNGGFDQDLDGINDDEDLCSDTPPGVPVWDSGDWAGCGEGQFRD